MLSDGHGITDIRFRFSDNTAISMNQPNKETIAAMQEAERIARDPSIKHYSDVEDALMALKE